jgi:endonuclease-3
VKTLGTQYGWPRYVNRFDPVDELICCILSQHSADANSFPAFTLLRATLPEWEDVVQAGPERVAEIVKGAGLANQKGKFIVGSLKALNEAFGDYTLDPLRLMPVPEAMAWLQTLPGVGPKTAAIVLCFGFGKGVIPVDTHVHRVSMRLGFIGPKTTANQAHDDLLRVIPEQLAFAYHSLLIQHGRIVCRAPLDRSALCVVAAMGPRQGVG